MKRYISSVSMGLLSLSVLAITASADRITHLVATEQVDQDADDPAIWINAANPDKSLVFGTCKGGGLYAFGLDGKTVQAVRGLNHLNNVDVEYGMAFGQGKKDIAVVTERGAKALRIFTIDPKTGHLSDATGNAKVFAGEAGERGAPMGIALYKRPRDGKVFAFVSRKEGPKEGYVWQYELTADAQGKVNLTKVREVGMSSGDEIESLAVDDELGYLYYSEEKVGIHKYYADPNHPQAAKRLALFGLDGFMADREGIGIYRTAAGKGYIVVSDQGDGESEYHIYSREGRAGAPHDHSKLITSISGGADTTDGLEVTNATFGRFSGGMLVVMNSKGKNFMLYRWNDVLQKIKAADAR